MNGDRWITSVSGQSAGGGRAGVLRPTGGEIAVWLGVYLALAALPLVLTLLRPLPPGRGLWIEFGVALGFVALAMLGLQFALTARFRRIAAPFGLDTLLHFHRQAGLVAFALALAHPLILIAAEPAYLAFLDPRSSFVRAAALWAVLGALTLLIVLTLWREGIGLAYEWWRASHGLLAVLVMLIGLAHVLRVGYYVAVPWKQALWVGLGGGAILLLVHARVVKPLLLRRTPYAVAEVRAERGRSWTLTLVPVGHPGLSFEAGQFVWLTLGPSPFSMQQHPFSISSSALAPERLEITVKELGDYTAGIGRVEPGTTAFVEGPHGAFRLPEDAVGAVFVVGGVGITPVMSILRTLRDLGDRRPLLLVYGNRDWDEVIFRDQLAQLEGELDLRVAHVLEDPPEGWTGERGLIDEDLLDRHLPAPPPREWEYFVCGPEPMMDAAEVALLERGVPLRRINSERFSIA
jgi:predicted ferric reductase